MNLMAEHIAPPSDILKMTSKSSGLIIIIPAGFSIEQGYDVTVCQPRLMQEQIKEHKHISLERQINTTLQD